MRENEFEKQVQDQMDELKFHPSSSVWPKVEKELRRKKKRRVVFYICLLAGIVLLGYSGYTYLADGSHTDLAETINLPASQKQSGPVGVETLAPDQEAGNTTTPLNEITSKQKEDQRITNENNIAAIKEAPGNNEVDKKIVSVTPQKDKPGIVKEDIVVKKKSESAPGSHDPEKKFTDRSIDNKNPGNDKIVADKDIVMNKLPGEKTVIAPAGDKNTITIDTINKAAVTNDKNIADKKQVDTTVNADSAVAKNNDPENTEPTVVQKAKVNRKIKLNAEISGGKVFHRSEVFSFGPSAQAMDYRVYYSSPASGASAGIAGRVIRAPSVVTPKGAFKAGITAELALSRKSSLSFGLRYVYITEEQEIGSFKDTMFRSSSYQYSNFNQVNGAYAAAKQETYRNKYHFIELPVLYHLQLNKGKKVPVLWNAGISLSHLVSTNALVYDTAAGGIYYRDKNAFNKLHFNFMTGFSFRFGMKNKLQWSIGPEFSMDMSSIMRQDVFTKKRYLMYGGITGRILLPRLKK
jgi:hypothetical protein